MHVVTTLPEGTQTVAVPHNHGRVYRERDALVVQLEESRARCAALRLEVDEMHADIVALKISLFNTRTALTESDDAREKAISTSIHLEQELNHADLVIDRVRGLMGVAANAPLELWTAAFDAVVEAVNGYGPFADVG